MKISKSDLIRIEKLEQKWEALKKDANKCRKQIERINRKYEQTEREKLIGKCFALRMKELNTDYGYARVEYFDEYTPTGTFINFYGKGKKRNLIIEFNKQIREELIEDGERIPHWRFNRYLRMARAMIKLK